MENNVFNATLLLQIWNAAFHVVGALGLNTFNVCFKKNLSGRGVSFFSQIWFHKLLDTQWPGIKKRFLQIGCMGTNIHGSIFGMFGHLSFLMFASMGSALNLMG